MSWSHLERSILHWTTDQFFEPCSGLQLLRQQTSSAIVRDGTTTTTSSTHHRPHTSAEYSTIKYMICVGFLESCNTQVPVFDLSHRTTCVSANFETSACLHMLRWVINSSCFYAKFKLLYSGAVSGPSGCNVVSVGHLFTTSPPKRRETPT